MNPIFLARQPIYDRQLRVFAYELLYRSNTSNRAEFTDGDQATSEVVVNAVMEIGLEEVVGHRPAFINMTRGFLTGALPLPLLKEKVVLEVRHKLLPNPDLLGSYMKSWGLGIVSRIEKDKNRAPACRPVF